MIGMNAEQISHNIRFFRGQHELTQKELAEKLNISRSVVAKWENNNVIPNVPSLLKLCAIFNISLDHIAGIDSFKRDLLKGFKRIHSSESKSFDAEIKELVGYLIVNPSFKEEVYRLKRLSNEKQDSVHQLFSDIIDQYEKL